MRPQLGGRPPLFLQKPNPTHPGAERSPAQPGGPQPRDSTEMVVELWALHNPPLSQEGPGSQLQ